jgi:hypothetical protein
MERISISLPDTQISWLRREAERLAGKLQETLLYDRIHDLFDRGLHRFLSDLQRTCREIGEHIATYDPHGTIERQIHHYGSGINAVPGSPSFRNAS